MTRLGPPIAVPIRAFAASIALVLGFAVTLHADSRIEFKATEGIGAGPRAILIGQSKYRYDEGADSSTIVDPAAGVMILLDHKLKTSTRIGRADLEKLGKDAAKAMKEMDDFVSRLPAQKRSQAQRDVAAMRADVPTVTDGGQTTVAGMACKIWLTRYSGQVIRESCMANAASIELPAADRETLVAVQAWSREIEAILAKNLAQSPATLSRTSSGS